jgi:tetratricopeptide (TPR) repeat protein
MLGRNGAKFLLVAGAAALALVLYLAPKKSMKQKESATGPETGFDIGDLVLFQENTLDTAEKARVGAWKDSIREGGSMEYYDSLAAMWDNKGTFALSAWYYEEKAKADRAEQSYLQAAYRYFDAYKQAVDSTMRVAMVEAAIRNYKTVLEQNPDNENAKTDLGVLYAEATPQPMQGIRLLQEVVAANPRHENAQLNLGILSVRSGQFDKAVQRFRTVLDINPERVDVRLMLARTYMEMGRRDSAALELERYKAAVGEGEGREAADRMLEELKTN